MAIRTLSRPRGFGGTHQRRDGASDISKRVSGQREAMRTLV